MSLRARAASATWWSTVEIASRYGVQIAVTVVLARLLQPADFALIAMLLVFTTLGAILINSGFGSALIQRQQITADDETTAFAIAFGTGLMLAVVLWFAAPGIAVFYRQPQLVALTHLVVWVLPLGGLAAVPDALLTKRLHFIARTRTELVASSVSGATAIVMAWRGYGVWSIGWQIVLAMGLRAALLWHAAHWAPRGRFAMASFHRLFGFGSYLLLAHMLDTGFLRIQTLLLGRFFDAPTLGYYTLAQSAQQAPASFMDALLYRVGLPVFSEVAGQPAKLREVLRLSMRTSMFVFLPCMVGLALAAKPFIVLVYGAKWQSAAPVLTILALAVSIWPAHVLNISAITALGRSDVIFRAEIFKKVFAITMVVISSSFGPLAVAGAVVFSNLLGAVVNAWYSRRLLGYGLLMQLSDQRFTLVSCLAAAAAGWAILHWTAAGAPATVLAILAGATVHLGGSALLANPALHELLNAVRSFYARRSSQAAR